MTILSCRYCKPQYQSSSRIVLDNQYWIANYDKHPISPGHMKLISKRHRDSFDELTIKEIITFQKIFRKAKNLIKKQYRPDGWNIGWNTGQVGGQTKFHLHIHIIPRYEGDSLDPTGGVRTINITKPGGNRSF